DAGAIKRCRRDRQLIALARHADPPRPLHVEAVALAPGAGERAIDEDVDADIGALGAELVSRHHVVDQRLDEGRLFDIEEFVAGTGRCRRLLRLRRRWKNGRCRGRGGSAPYDAALEKVTPPETLVGHDSLPDSDILVELEWL